MSAHALLSSLGGVAPSRQLRDRGVSQDRLAKAVRVGRLVRPRRGWVAFPDADPALVAAARDGVVLTCMTQARRLGLWTRDPGKRHVAASSAARPTPGNCVVHWGRPVVPRAPGKLEDPLLNVLQYVAACRPHEDALVVWNSALNLGLTDVQALRRCAFTGAAVRLRDEAQPYFDSGLETLAASRLRWTRLRLVPQAHLFGHRVDLLIGERLVLQIDGATHTGKQRDEDIAFDAFLVTRGYTVVRIGYRQIMDDWHAVQLRLMECIAQGLHLA